VPPKRNNKKIKCTKKVQGIKSTLKKKKELTDGERTREGTTSYL
jgi:hypothetical protein